MFSNQPTSGFTSFYPKPYFNELYPHAQDRLGVYPGMFTGLHATAPTFKVSPWAWHSSEEMGIREDSSAYYPYSTSFALPQVQSTYPVDQTLPPLWQMVGDLLYNTKGPEIACPQPIHPLPKWINMNGWEDDEDKTTLEGDKKRIAPIPGPTYIDDNIDSDEELSFPHQSLLSFILSPDPDPEELPAPFFHPSSDPIPPPHTSTSLSPEAWDLPLPCFDPNPNSPLVPDVEPRSHLSGFERPPSPWPDSFGSIMFPNSGNLPPPGFEIHDRIGVGGFWQFPGPLDCRQDQPSNRGARGHAYWRLDGGFWEAALSGEREVSGSEHYRRSLDWTWDR